MFVRQHKNIKCLKVCPGANTCHVFDMINMMNSLKNILLFFLLFNILGSAKAQFPGVKLKSNEDIGRYCLWYNKPAANWNQALPLGNGFIGGMVFGAPGRDRIQLNEGTIWGGGPNQTVDSSARAHITEVRALLAEKKYVEAQTIANKYLGPKGNSGMPYQLAGDLFINFPGHDVVTDYYRDLDISRAVASVHYKWHGVTFKREYLTAFQNNVLMVRITADRPKMINCQLILQSPLVQKVSVNGNSLMLSGAGSKHENQPGKVRFNIMTRVKTAGGRSHVDTSGIYIENADTAIVYLAIATNFVNYHDVSADPYERALKTLNAAYSLGFPSVMKDHQAAYQAYFNRVRLNLGSNERSLRPTDERIADFAMNNDNQLAELYFQFGRYLLICSSQPGSQPSNLQGIWNGELKGPWDSKYTVNINTEMNYWPVEVTQLSELGLPLYDMVEDLATTGRATARVMYGARGWMLHHNTDIWRITGVVDGAFWGLWPTANAWLCQHLWEHYLYTGDKSFLRKYYPIMKGAAEYFIDVLQTEPDHGWLVVSPSVSPEHEYIGGETPVSVTAGATMDNQLVFGLFSNLIQAASVLQVDQAFADTLAVYRAKLPPMQIGKYGQLQEWLEDLDRPNDNHRHVSHLYGLFPANQITPFSQPKLFAAAKNSLIYRGDVSTGWSMAWKINLWARLLDGNHAYKLIKDQIRPVVGQAGGTYPNLFDAHPPFQIDGNFGCTSGIAEMLLQSHDGAIYLLPALPDAWPRGSISGLMARGGFKVDMAWENYKITSLVIHSSLGGNCRIRVNTALKSKLLKKAAGSNANPFYQTVDLPQAIINGSSSDLSFQPGKTMLFDLSTRKGMRYKVI